MSAVIFLWRWTQQPIKLLRAEPYAQADQAFLWLGRTLKLHWGGRMWAAAPLSRGVCRVVQCSLGRPGAGPAWQREQLLSLQTATHPQCLQCTQLLPGCITKVPRSSTCAGCGASGCEPCWDYILQVCLLWRCKHGHAFMASRAFRWMISVVRYWPDSTFPHLDYKRKTASGRFKCRSVDMLYQSSSTEHRSTCAPPGPIP